MTTKIDANEAVQRGGRASDIELEPMVIDDVADSEGEGDNVDPAWVAELERARADLQAGGASGARSAPMTTTTARDLLAGVDEQVDYLVDGVLVRGALFQIVAEPKSDKTWLVAETALAVATGSMMCGHWPARVGRVLVVALEDSRGGIRARLRALMRGRGDLDNDVALSRLHVAVRPRVDLAQLDDVAWILATARRLGGFDLIVIDTLRAAHTVEENSSSEMSVVLGHLRALRDATAAATGFTHHMGRPGKDTAGRRLAHRTRGSTSIHGAVDATVALELRGREHDEAGGRDVLGVDVETRDARGAGVCGLTLETEGPSGAYARVARWSWSAEPGGSDAHEIRTHQLSKKRASDAPASVLQALAQLGATDPCQYHAVDAVRAITGSRKQAAIDVLYGLAQDKQVERGLRGGWRLPVEVIVPIVPIVPGNDRNGGNGGAFLIVPVVPTPLGGERGTMGTLGPAAPDVLEPNHAPTFPHMPKDRTVPTDQPAPPAPTEAADQIDPPRTEIDVDDAPTWADQAVEQADRNAELARLNDLCGRAMGLLQ